MDGPASSDNVEIVSYPFPLTEAATCCCLQKRRVDAIGWQVIGGWVKGFQNALRSLPIKQHLTADSNKHVVNAALQSWGPWVACWQRILVSSVRILLHG